MAGVTFVINLKVVALVELFFFLTFCSARMGFIKDQSTTHIKFPPRLTRSFDSDIPVGHLRPLGWQRQPSGRVPESKMLDPASFRDQYEVPGLPVVFRAAMTDVPATNLWTDEYLKKNYGLIDIHVTVKKEQFKAGPQQMKLKKFIREYMYEDWYLANVVPQEMMTELALPKCLKCGFHRYLQEAEMWLSSGGTSSLLHSHADHNMHCLLSGRKDFILIDRSHKDKLEYHDREPHEGAGYSTLDTEMINMFAYPEVANIPWTWSTLQPGDCMFVPSGYLHQVRSYGRSLSATMHWSPTPEMNLTDCIQKDLDQMTPLSEAPFLWTYSVADRQLTDMRLDASSLRHHLIVWMRNEETFRKELFVSIYADAMSGMEKYPAAADVWKMLVANDAKELSRNEISKLDDSVLEKVAKVFNEPHQTKKEIPHDEL